jgi:sugar phosphate permease
LLKTAHQAPAPFFGEIASWKLVFIAAGLPGLVAAALLLTVREPARHQQLRQSDPNAARFATHVRAQWRTLSLLYIFYAAMGFIAYATVMWAPALYTRSYHMDLASAGLSVGAVVSVAGFAGALAAGFLSDLCAKFGPPGARLRVSLLGIALNLAVLGFWTRVHDAQLSLALLGVSVFANNLGLTNAAVTLQDITPNELRGRVLALFQILAGLATGAAPTAVALFTDYVFKSDAKLFLSLAIVPTVTSVAATLVGIGANAAYRRTCSELTFQSA